MTPHDAPKSITEMMADIMGNVRSLVRNEVALARSEVSESLVQVGSGIGTMAVAFVLWIAGLNVLTAALVVAAMGLGVPPIWAPAVIGGGLLLVAFVLFQIAKSRFTQIGLMPTRVARNFQRDAAAVKEAHNDN